MENSKDMWKIFTNPPWNFKNIYPKSQVTELDLSLYIFFLTVRQQLSRVVLSNFLPSSSLSNIKLIFHYFQLHVTHVWNLSPADPNLHNYFALAVLVGSQKCFQSKWELYSLPSFSLPVLPKSLVLVAGYCLCAPFPLLCMHFYPW